MTSWKNVPRVVKSSSSCIRFSLIQFKVSHRTHQSKARLAELFAGRSDEGCNRCSQTPCDSHVLVMPQIVQLLVVFLWYDLKDFESEYISIPPKIAIFGRPLDKIKAALTQKIVITFTSLIACWKILLLWKSPLPPSFKAWLSNSLFLLRQIKIKIEFMLRGSSNRFYYHWKPMIYYVNQLPSGEISL